MTGLSKTTRFTLLNTRPEHQAQALTALVNDANGQVIDCPLLHIKPCAIVPEPWRVLADCNKVILTSVNAVQALQARHARQTGQAAQTLAKLSDRFNSSAEFFAIGAATRQAALDAGLPMQASAQDAPSNLYLAKFDSETLLAHPSMHASKVKGQRIALIKGVGGRALMANTLQERGAILETLAVYQRECAPFCLEAWRAFTHANNPILLLTSWESFECLQRHLQRYESGEVYQKAPWDFLTATVVFGQRIADHLQQIGWQGAIEVCAPSQFAIVTAVESILERQNK